MGRCSMCGNMMATSEGCVPHKVLLSDGTVIDEPEHGEDSLVSDNNRCHDCGAPQGGIHHPGCDSSRQPDGSQILIDAAAYWDPETETDPREPESDYIFLVILEPDEEADYETERKPLIPFDAYDLATEYIEREDWADFSLKAMQVESELPGT